MIKNKNIFTRKKPLLLALSGVGLFAVSALLSVAVLHYASPRPTAASQATITASQPDDGACKLTDGLRVCLSSSKQQLTSSDAATLKETFTNTTSQEVPQSYECSQAQAITLNGLSLAPSGGCEGLGGNAKMLAPGATATAEFQLSGSLLKTGDNTLNAQWLQYDSGDIHISKTTPTEQELAKQFTGCQTVPDTTSSVGMPPAPSYCIPVGVILKDSVPGNTSCAGWRAAFGREHLTPPCTDIMDIGTSFVFVPREDSASWLAKIKAMPEVKSAFIDKEILSPLSQKPLH